MAYSDNFRRNLVKRMLEGECITDIEEEEKEKSGITRQTLSRWKAYAEKHSKDDITTLNNLKARRAKLSALNPTPARTKSIAELTNVINKMEKTEERKEKRAAKKRKPVGNLNYCKQAEELRRKIIDDEIDLPFKLLQYQKDFLLDEHQFNCILKARQTGFTYTASICILLAALSGRDQIIISASFNQALNFMHYIEMNAKVLGIEFCGTDKAFKKELANGATITAVATNWRTAQGYTGDLWMDEFAWYQNPKKIWGALVPSIGSIKGRLTIMSTPFEDGGIFADIVKDVKRYFMFNRRYITIYDAIKDGLPFDLEIMRPLFDADTWASMYECQFINDEEAYFSIKLIKSCVNSEIFYYTPEASATLLGGYDVGRVVDLAVLSYLQKTTNKIPYRLANVERFKQPTFDDQELILKDYLRNYQSASLKIDKTGIGMNLAETITKKYPVRATGVHFSAPSKEVMCKNLKVMFERGMIEIPNDPILIASIHSIKRKAAPSGKQFLYDAKRNDKGHADDFWSLALAAMAVEALPAQGHDGGSMIC